jgi:hypothetical protein
LQKVRSCTSLEWASKFISDSCTLVRDTLKENYGGFPSLLRSRKGWKVEC